MADNRKPKLMPNWTANQTPRHNSITSSHTDNNEEALERVPVTELRQGELYILKIKLIAIGLFQGWDDDMCCFFILRTDRLEELRWSEARYSIKYLPENFDVYHAFDYAGNPPIHLWTKHLQAVIPINWFNIFEEARHMQRQWNLSYWEPQSIDNEPLDTIEEKENTEQEDEKHELDSVSESESIEQSAADTTDESTPPTTPPTHHSNTNNMMTTMTNLRIQPNPYNYTATQRPPPEVYPTQAMTIKQDYTSRDRTEQPQQSLENISPPTPIKAPEIKKRRSFPFFGKKKKSTKSKSPISSESSSINTPKRKSLPPSLHRKEEEAPPSLPSHSDLIVKKEEPITPAEQPSVIKPELFDFDSYFDMQATFAFLNSTKTDVSPLDNYTSVSVNK